MTNPWKSATLEIPLSTPVSHGNCFRTTTDDEGYCGQSPGLANKTTTNSDAYAPASADLWSFELVFSADPSSTNNQEWNMRSQPLSAVSTDEVTSLKSVPRSGLPTDPILQPHTGSGYHEHAPSNVNVSSSPTYGHSLRDRDTTSYPLVEARNPAQWTSCLSDPIFNSGLNLDGTSESLSAVYPSFEELSHANTFLPLPSTCLGKANDHLGTEDLEHKYEASTDEGIFVNPEVLHSA